MPIAEDSAGGSPVPVPTDLTTNLTGEATGSGTLDYTTGDIDIVVTVVDNGHNHILDNITDVQVNNAISGQVLKYNGNVWVNGTDENAGITALVQDLSPQLGGNLDLNNRNITGTGNLDYTGDITLTGTVDGRNVSVDGTKLDGIEPGATADQTAAQIKTAYESNANTNNFADADVSKLSGIEPGATADQTAAQIKTAYESNSNTNAFTDADHTKLDGIETAADVTDTTNVVASLTAGTNVTIAADGTISATGGTSGIAHVVDDTSPELGGNLSLNSHDITGTGNLNFTGNLTLSGTVDGRDVAADGTKLDGIEASADVTDTANVTAAGALMDSEVTNLAQVKAFDSSDYATAAQGTTADAALPKAGGTMTGDILFNDSVKAKFGTSSDLQIYHDGTHNWIRDVGTGALFLDTNSAIHLYANGSENMLYAQPNAGVQVFYDNVKKLETTSTGIDVTGTAQADFMKISTPDAGGSPSTTAILDIHGYEGRGAGIKIRDNANSASGASNREWFVGSGYNQTGFNIGYSPTGSQSSYAAQNKLTIDTSGNVGIGTTSPNHELHIESASPTIRLVDTDGNNTLDIGQSGSACYVDFDNTVRFRNLANVERLRIDTGGIDVTGVTKTSGSGYNPANTGWATNASLITSGSYGGGLTMIDGSNAFSVRVDTGGLAMRIAQGATSGALNSDIAVFTNNSLDVKRDINTTGNIYLNSSNQDSPQVVWQSQGYGDQYIDNYQGRLRVVNSGAEQLSISQGGNMNIYGNLDVSGVIRCVVTSAPAWDTNTRFWGESGFGARYDSYQHRWDVGVTRTEAMRIDQSGNVSIASGDLLVQNTSPVITLKDTDGNATTSTPYVLYQSSTGSQLGYIGYGSSSNGKLNIVNSNNDDITFFTDNTQRMAVTGSGVNVTGATTTTGTSGTLQWSAGTAGQKLAIYGYDNSTFYHRLDSGNATNYQWGAYDNIPIYTITNNTIRTTLLGNGNFGVGTTSPADKVHVEGNIYLGSSSRSVYTGGSGDLRLQTNTGEVKVLTANGATTNLITSGTGIDIPTSLDVGTTLNVGNATPAGGGTIESHVQNSSTPALITYSGSGSLRTHISFENANGQVGKINTAGTQTFYVTSSDYRLKTDIQPMQGSIDRVKALKPCNFEWVNDSGRVDGFIAHEAQEVVPEAIVGEKDAMQDQEYVESKATGDIYTPAVDATYETIQVELTPAVDATYDDEGNELTPAVDATYEEQQQELTPAIDEVIHSSDVVEPDELEEGQLWRETTEKVMATRQVPDYQGIDQSKIVPLLTSALQDAIAKIEALETRLEALES